MLLSSLSSLAVLALSASAALSPLSNLVHLHPHAQADTRVNVSMFNMSTSFRDVNVDGHIYTVMPKTTLLIKAPAGTEIFAASEMPFFHKGQRIIEVTPQLDHKRLSID